MIKVKDGYAKLIGTTYLGSADRVLLSNGGDKVIGNASGNIPISNGTVNTNLNADLLDGKHDGELTAKYLTVSNANITTAPGSGLIAYSRMQADSVGNLPRSNNANGVITINTHTGNYHHLLGFTGNGMFYRNMTGKALDETTDWNTILHSGNYSSYLGYIGTTPVQASSAALALTGITNATISGLTNTGTLTITNTEQKAHLLFSRGNYNYISAPTGGSIAFCVNGNAAGTGANSEMVISDGTIFPGTTNVTSLGNTSHYWTSVYTHGFYKNGSSNSYVLLGGGSHKALSDFAMASAYVKKAGDTMTGVLTMSKDTAIHLWDDSATTSHRLTIRCASDIGRIYNYTGSAYGAMYVGHDGTNAIVITSGLNVGIGTGSPSSKLHVNGGLLNITANSGTLTIGSLNTSYTHYSTTGGTHWFNKAVAINGNHFPHVNNSFSSGTSSYRWSNVYSVLGNFTGNVTLYSASGDSPHLYFLRGTTTDAAYDWDMFVTNGSLTLRQNNTGTWNTALTAADNYMSTGWRFNIGRELSVKDQRFNYGLAYYNANTYTVTGTMVITLPNGWNESMNTYEIDIYEYIGYSETTNNVLHSKLIIDGYNYNHGSAWINYGYTQIGSYNKGVRLGYNGSKCVIMLGTTSTTWTYPQVHLSRVITGYSNQTAWSTGYSISVVTDESGYSSIVTANRLRQIFDDVVANTFRGRATSVGSDSMIMYPLNGNEVNFGGSTASNNVYFGHKAVDSKPIPTLFIFGGGTGTAALRASSLTSPNILDLIGTSGICFKFNNNDATSLVLNQSGFRPFAAANGKLDLGASNARWKDLYALTGNFSSDITATKFIGDLLGNATTAGTAGRLSITSCLNGTTNNDLWSTIKSSNSSYLGTATIYEVYDDGGPFTYGHVLDIVTALSNHWQPQLWFDAGKNGRLRYRNKDYNDNSWGGWRALAFISDIPTSLPANGGNADTLDGREGSGYTYHVEGISSVANKYVKIAILPTSSTVTHDSVTISGTIGGWQAACKSDLKITIGRRDGVIFKGYSYPRNGWDIFVNNNGEVLISLEIQYTAWDLSVTCHQATFDYRTNYTPADTNFTKMSNSTHVVWFNNDGSVASATKLQTARTIWGQSFDGTGNVSGAFTMPNKYHIYVGDTSGSIFSAVYADAANNLIFGEGAGAYSYNTYIGGQNLFLRYGGNKIGLILNSSGNVGIGTIAPLYKLDIIGDLCVNRNNHTSSNTTFRINCTDNNVNLYAVDADDAACYLKFYINGTLRMILTAAGNLGIGTTSPEHKLHVNGDLGLAGDLTFRQSDVLTPVYINSNSGSYYQRIRILDTQGGSSDVFTFQQSANSGETYIDLFSIKANGKVASLGFIKTDSSNSYVLLGGGSHKALSDFAPTSHGLHWVGFSQRSNSSATWGTLISSNGYTPLFWLDSTSGGGVAFSDAGGQTFMQIDGHFYQNEGRYLVLDTNNYSSTLDSRYYTENEVNNLLAKYLPLAGGIMTGALNTASTSGNWITGMTSAAIRYNSLNAINSSSFWRFFNMKSAGGHVVCYGGLGNNIGFYGYYSGRTANGTDWSFVANTANGNWTATNSIYAAHFYENSDILLKTNILEILDSDKMPIIKEFDWKENNSHSYGLIALELEEQGYSELVSTKDDGYKTVNYSAALSLIVGKLQVKIKELEKEIETLKNKN